VIKVTLSDLVIKPKTKVTLAGGLPGISNGPEKVP